MEVLRENVAGVDVHKDMLAITILKGGAKEQPEAEQFESKTFTADLIKCGQKFLEKGVTEVALESTGVYWKPLHNTWTPMGIKLTVAQAAHVSRVPGRKTDVSDSYWLATLHRHGLINSSFVPPEEFQRMRLLSRHRTNLTEDLSRIKNRIQKTLEDGNIKWGSVASDVFGKSGLEILKLLASGVQDPTRLAEAVVTKIKKKEDVEKALTNCFTKEHCFLIKELMTQYDHLHEKIRIAEEELWKLAMPYKDKIDLLKEIPGINDILAIGILSEASDKMENFADERKFAAWAGTAAGNNESGGKKKDLKQEKETLT